MQALVFPSGRSMLIDCGGAPVGDQRFVSRQVTAWLLNNRIHPDWIAVSHFHSDHCGTLPDLLPIFQPAQVLVSETPNENPVYTRARAASPRGTLWTKVGKSHRIHIDDARLIWLFPNQVNPPSSATSNGHSQVIRLHTPAFSMLFCGDIGTEEEARLTEQTLFHLQSDVLKVPHHGSKSSSSPHFLQTVSPRLALIHCSRHNLYGFPHPLVRERYTQFEIPLRCTWQGDLILTSRHNRLHAVSADGLGIPGLPTLCL
jgi:competence protein ComEC